MVANEKQKMVANALHPTPSLAILFGFSFPFANQRVTKLRKKKQNGYQDL